MRSDNLSWDLMFFGVAFWAAMRSKDPSTQCGACITRDNRPLGFGYNGFINGVKDTLERWGKEEKKKYVYHSEENAIRNSMTSDFSNTHMYIWTSNPNVYLPCERCARTIAHYGIRDVHVLVRKECLCPKDDTRWNTSLTLEIFKECGVSVHEHDSELVASRLCGVVVDKLSPRQ